MLVIDQISISISCSKVSRSIDHIIKEEVQNGFRN